MTGFQSKRQASKSLLEQALDALELARDAHCLPGTPTTLVYQAIDAIRAELAQENPWRDAIDAELICCHIGTVESFPTAKYALNELINWYVKVALDPEVSSAAKALVDRGAAQPQAEPVAWRRYNRSIGWQYEDGVTSFASDPSAEPLYAAPQAAVAEPLIDEMDAVASRYAHKLALDLECVLSNYIGPWYDTAMQTLSDYRMAMNRIHERESPTFMGEPDVRNRTSGGSAA